MNMPKKPFPWKCPQCKEKAVREEIVTYSADIPHDGKVYHVDVKGLKSPTCGNCGLIWPDAEALEVIDTAFFCTAKLLSPKSSND